jgi:hypothetical protein
MMRWLYFIAIIIPLSCLHAQAPDLSAVNVITTGGTTPRSLASRTADITNVLDWGAVGNGSTDDTTAIQLAATNLPAGGGMLLFPAGHNFLIHAGTTIPSNVSIMGYGATITAAAAANWSGGAISNTFNSTGTNVGVYGLKFVYPIGSALNGGGAAHILGFTGGATHVIIRDNTSNGGGDFVGGAGAQDVYVAGNRATNLFNSCYDFWGGTSSFVNDIKVIGNYCSSTTSASSTGFGGINYTGLNTDGSASTNTGFQAIGNEIYVNSPGGQAINVNGHASAGADNDFIITGNKIFINNLSVWGILVSGTANNGKIAHNILQGGAVATGNFAAIAAFAPATNITIEQNDVYNWQASTEGIFVNTAVGGNILGNNAYSSSSTLIGAVDTTTAVSSNGTGASGDIAASRNGGLIIGNGAGGVPTLYLNTTSGNGRLLEGQTSGLARWFEYLGNGTAESSGSGSDFKLIPANDAGTAQTLLALTMYRKTGQIVLPGSVPTIASGACGTTTNGTISGSNQAGKITIGSATTTACAVSFSATLTVAPVSCTFSPANATAAAIGTTVPYISAISTGGFTLTGSVLASTNWYYQCF